MLSDDEGAGGQEGTVGLAAEEAEGLGIGLFFVIGRVEVDDVDWGGGFGEALQQSHHAAVFEGISAGDFKVGQVGAE